MTSTTSSTTPGAAPEHDHAWRRVSPGPDWKGIVGEYHCDLCPAVWSM